jgi:hypothetical protein
MMNVRIASLVLLSAALTLGGCASKPHPLTVPTIPIKNCKATIEWQDIAHGGQVEWLSMDGSVYEIVFKHSYPIPPPVTSGNIYTAHGSAVCTSTYIPYFCKYEYTIKKNGVQCGADPGIRILP